MAWMAQDVHPSGAAGDATLATAEKGKAMAALQAKGFAALLADMARFQREAGVAAVTKFYGDVIAARQR